MLFSSFEFLFAFLPLVLAVFCLLRRTTARMWWLAGASLFFYGWWNPPYLLLLAASIGGNYLTGRLIHRAPPNARQPLLILGLAGNLGLLGYFKYAGFLVDSFGYVSGTSLARPDIVLPLAISFFTFQQIAWLVDVYRRGHCADGLVQYTFFVTFFPQLIAGPIIHHGEIIPQVPRLRPSAHGWAVGLTLLTLGLAKKLIVADSLIPAVHELFGAADRAAHISLADAWVGTLAYTMQLYFDFSGYSDMAIGLAAFFGVTLPVNFDSPYRSTSIVEFWRRWHITLSRFLRDYLYIPLGGSRCSPPRQLTNLMVTMLLGGLWHGAGWTFVFWGGLHGSYLIANHAWRQLPKPDWCRRIPSPCSRLAAWALTFLAVMVGWVFFRASSFGSAQRILVALAGMNGGELDLFFVPSRQALFVLGAAALAWCAPNTQQIIASAHWLSVETRSRPLPPLEWLWGFRPNLRWACWLAFLLVASVMRLSSVSEFLYFQF